MYTDFTKILFFGQVFYKFL